MPKAIIADDEPLMRELLKEKLGVLWPELEILGEAADGVSALRQIDELKPDIAFLDIRMPGLSGIEVARTITYKPRIVFVTAFDAYAVQAFEADALDYLVKPIALERLAKVVTKLKKTVVHQSVEHEVLTKVLASLGVNGISGFDQAEPNVQDPLTWIQVDAGGGKVVMVNVNDVHFFVSDTKYTRVVSSECDGLITTSLKDLRTKLDPLTFLQAHRSSLVNRHYIKAIHRVDSHIEIEVRGNPTRIKVSDTFRAQFKAM